MEIPEYIQALRNSKSESDREQCVLLLKDYLGAHPTNAMAWYDLASCHDYLGREVEAEACYQKTYELGLKDFPLQKQQSFYVGYGSTLRNNRKFKESQQILSEGLETFPDYTPLKIFLALTFYSQGLYQDSSRILFEACSAASVTWDGYERAVRFYTDKLDSYP